MGDHDRIAELEARLQRVEDQLAIHQLINSWGPAVDTGNAEVAAQQFSDDAILQSDLSYLVGPPSVRAMVLGEGHQALIRGGSAHVPAFPVVRIDGDQARAVGYTRVYRYTPEGYEIWRVSANYWELRRTDAGWRITKRVNHPIDGGPEATELLNLAFED